MLTMGTAMHNGHCTTRNEACAAGLHNQATCAGRGPDTCSQLGAADRCCGRERRCGSTPLYLSTTLLIPCHCQLETDCKMYSSSRGQLLTRHLFFSRILQFAMRVANSKPEEPGVSGLACEPKSADV